MFKFVGYYYIDDLCRNDIQVYQNYKINTKKGG
jgi:hypothetical protein